MSMLFAYGGALTFYFRFLDRLSNVLLDSMHLAASYVCRMAGGSSARELGAAICLTGSMLTVEKIDHKRGSYAAYYGCGRRTGGGCWRVAAARSRGSSSSGAYCSTPSGTAWEASRLAGQTRAVFGKMCKDFLRIRM
jgi:hypothetical protein